MRQLHISKGNSKIGDVPSISFPPHVTCAEDAPCRRLCYAWRLSRTRPTVQAAWQRNLDLWKESPRDFIDQLRRFLGQTPARLFRWFVAGDIPSLQFLRLMHLIALEYPHIQFMAYTKRWREWRQLRQSPPNLVIRYSLWPVEGWHTTDARVPWAAMIPKGGLVREGSILCGGECGPCGYKCWDADFNISIRQH